MTVIDLRSRPAAPARAPVAPARQTRRRRRLPGEVGAVVILAFALYLACAALLVYRYHSIDGDALSRVHNGALVLFSRDPHLAAVGFVWNPLPSLLDIPLLLFKGWAPSLESLGFAGSIVAAACGAAGAGVLVGLLRDWRVRRPLRWTLVAAYALHPLVLYSGANGMSEAVYLLFLLLACRHLARWIDREGTSDLVLAGIALALGYLTRYEVVVAGAGATAVVAAVRWARTAGPWRARAREAVVDAAIVAAPLAFTFVAWALASWIIVGSPFEQFTSVYGNASQLAVLRRQQAVLSGTAAVHLVARQLLLLEIALPLAVGVPLLLALRRRSAAVLAPVAIFGGILAFEVAACTAGLTASWLRYYVVAVPLAVLCLATMAAPDRGPLRPPPLAAVLAAVLALAGATGSVPMVHDHHLAKEESALLDAVLDRRHATGASRLALQRLRTERRVVAFLDSLHPGRGGVLIDAFVGYQVTTQSRHPTMFVVTSDRDFQQALADPATFKIRYIVVPDPVRGVLDAVNRAYPALYGDGAGIATLVRQFDNEGDLPTWRIYRVDTPGP